MNIQCVWAALLFIVLSTNVSAKDLVIYGGYHQSYQNSLLTHALSYQKEELYQVKHFDGHLPKLRAYEILAARDGIDVVFGGATIEREQLNQAIRIPVYKGLNGWRVALIKKENVNLLASQATFNDFKNLLAGQHHLWSDVKVLESNGIRVHRATNEQGIFFMLAKGRIDYFPRSILEIEQEQKKYPELDLVIEQYTMFHYPTAYYYYVNFDDHVLRKHINDGLEQAIADGSFDRLYMQYFGHIIKNARKTNRRIFSLTSPLLSKETPLDRKELWVDLASQIERPSGLD